jgi:putative secretion ATPase (PEP-CTERM system associated)
MYESYFRLATKPFDLVPNPDFIYQSKSHRKALTYLDYGIQERAGFIMLTGNVGCGKTTIIRELLNRHYDHIVLSKVFNTLVDSQQLLTLINDDFGLPVLGKDRITLLRDLNEFLIAQYAEGNRPVLIIDEAQNLSPELLEEVRMLSNLETADTKLLQIILVGQPELRAKMAAPEMLQLRQRISINCHLTPLSRPETEEYILHRLEVAGNRQAVAFAPEAIDIIYQYSRGVPRLVNIICDFLLLSAFAEETTEISEEMTREIVGDLDFESHFWTSDQHKEADSLPFSYIVQAPVTGETDGHIALLLTEIAQRLDTMERENLAANQSQFKELNERLMSLQNAFRYHVGETDTAVAELSRRIERFKLADDKSSSVTATDKPGLVRRIFGS